MQEQEILELLQTDLKKIAKPLRETVSDIKKHGFSEYPIILAHPEEIAMADKVLDRFEYETAFHFSASTLEVLIGKGVILKDKKAILEDQFKRKEGQVCILLVHPDSMKIIFSPLTFNE